MGRLKLIMFLGALLDWEEGRIITGLKGSTNIEMRVKFSVIIGLKSRDGIFKASVPNMMDQGLNELLSLFTSVRSRDALNSGTLWRTWDLTGPSLHA